MREIEANYGGSKEQKLARDGKERGSGMRRAGSERTGSDSANNGWRWRNDLMKSACEGKLSSA